MSSLNRFPRLRLPVVLPLWFCKEFATDVQSSGATHTDWKMQKGAEASLSMWSCFPFHPFPWLMESGDTWRCWQVAEMVSPVIKDFESRTDSKHTNSRAANALSLPLLLPLEKDSKKKMCMFLHLATLPFMCGYWNCVKLGGSLQSPKGKDTFGTNCYRLYSPNSIIVCRCVSPKS